MEHIPTKEVSMTRNLGSVDRIVRGVLVAPLALAGALAVGPAGPAGILLFLVGAIMLVTAATGFCPLYRLVGVDSRGGRPVLN
jgi:hypothetical protein